MRVFSVVVAVFLAMLVFSGTIQQTEALSCEYGGRAGCISSCAIQNCATGYCGSDNVCRCSRCGTGPNPWPGKK